MRGEYLRTAFLAPMDRLSDRLTWKRLQIDGNILGGISQALYPGEGENPKIGCRAFSLLFPHPVEKLCKVMPMLG